MSDRTYVLSHYPKRVGRQVPQFLSSWSAHVESWTNVTDVPVFTVRFEDMVANTEMTYRAALDFLGVEYATESFDAALAGTEFHTLQAKERAHGFREKPSGTHKFFHQGGIQYSQCSLTSAQAAAIVRNHGETMARLNYVL